MGAVAKMANGYVHITGTLAEVLARVDADYSGARFALMNAGKATYTAKQAATLAAIDGVSLDTPCRAVAAHSRKMALPILGIIKAENGGTLFDFSDKLSRMQAWQLRQK